ncbi:hypothetical protein ACJX0J_033068, partial [Zea mays]
FLNHKLYPLYAEPQVCVLFITCHFYFLFLIQPFLFLIIFISILLFVVFYVLLTSFTALDYCIPFDFSPVSSKKTLVAIFSFSSIFF